MEIKIIESFGEFKAEVDRLSDLILKAKDHRKAELLSKGRSVPKRISNEELDLGAYMNEMLSVHKTLQWRGHNQSLGIRKKNARAVALAGICELIKAEYIGNFWDIYTKHIGWGANTTCYNWIWEEAFKEAGIDLILGRGGYRREFVQTLVLESGIPRKGRKTVIEFFILYWRYLRHENDIEKLIRAIVEGTINLSFIPGHDARALTHLCISAQEFSKAFSHAIDKLKTVFAYIEESEDVLSGDLAEYAETIYRETGVDIGDVFRGGNQLRNLYERILGLVTPDKLRKILKSTVYGTRIVIPDGTNIRVEEYRNILYGEHRLREATFSCVPTLAYTIADLKNLPFNNVMRDGNDIVLKSRSNIYPVINGRERPDLVSAFYVRGGRGHTENCGNIFHGVIYPATTINVSTEDGWVRESFCELDGFYCSPTFQHYYKDNKHNLTLFFPTLRLKAAALANKMISIYSDGFEGPIFDVQLDEMGFGVSSNQQTILPEPHEGIVKIWASDADSSAPVVINGSSVDIEISAESAMLFPALGNRHFLIRPKNIPSKIGTKQFFLFISKNEEFSVANMNIIHKGECGSYGVLTIEWGDIEKECRITVGKREWVFEHCVDLNLILKKTAPRSLEFVELGEKQGTNLKEFELIIYPIPSEKIKEELFWNVAVNNHDPVRIRYSKGPEGNPDGTGLRFSCKEIVELLGPLWKFAGESSSVIEVALSTSDLAFNGVRFWLFPYIRVLAPPAFRDGDEVILQLQMDRADTTHSIVMRDIRGRSRASLRLEYEDGHWRRLKKEFSGSIEIKRLGASLNFRAVPIVHGVVLGSRSKQEASAIRNLLRKDLSDMDLVVSPQSSKPPVLKVNEKTAGISATNFADLTTIGLDQICGLIRLRKNKVDLLAGKESVSFTVGLDLNIEEITFRDHLLGEGIVGKVTFIGPEDSSLCFAILKNPDTASEKELEPYEIDCDGEFHKDYAINISITQEDLEDAEILKIKLTLKFDKHHSDEFYSYGETWLAKAQKELDPEDYGIIKDNVISCIREGRYFEAQKYIDMAQDVVSTQDLEWVEQSRAKISKMIRHIQVQSIASQIVSILRKEFLD